MKELNLNKLKYPMFKIALNEAWLLTEALRFLRKRKDKLGCSLLCLALDSVATEYPEERKRCDMLELKIQTALNEHLTLVGKLGLYNGGDYDLKKLRRIWIKKLLKHRELYT